MNIVEVLKNKPKGFKLYSPAFGECEFDCCSGNYISVRIADGNSRTFYEDGRLFVNGECMLFPSKENRNWETLLPKFKKGDVITNSASLNCVNSRFFAVFDHLENREYTKNVVVYNCVYRLDGTFKVETSVGVGDINSVRLATPEEKEKFLRTLGEKGYFIDWNGEVRKKRFDFTTLKPFDKVLVRDNNTQRWKCSLFSHYIDGYMFVTVSCNYNQCVPYNNETKHLVGTTFECPDFYKM